MNKQLLFVLFAFLGFASIGRSDDSLERVRKAGKLVVAIDPTYPPMEFQKDGKPQGFDIDFAGQIAAHLGVKVEFVVMEWEGIIPGLKSGDKYDVIISSMSVTEDRKKEVGFVEYIAMGQVFVCRDGVIVKEPADMVGKIVAVQSETTSHTWVKEQVEKLKAQGATLKDLKAFPDATDTFNALKAGQVDVIVTDEPVGRYYCRRDKAFHLTGEAMGAEPVGIAVRKDDRKLRSAIARAVKSMRSDGSLRSLSEEWFGAELGEDSADTEDSVDSSNNTGLAGFVTFSRTVVLPRLVEGLRLTLILTAASGLCGILLGLVVALARISRSFLLSKAALIYVTLFRGTPLLLQLCFVFFAVSPLLRPLLEPLGLTLGALACAILALSMNASAYVAEIFRAAIQSIDKGQMEAARALGMSHTLAMRRVILPQTFRRLVPPLVNELAALSKDTSLVLVLGLQEMLYETKSIAATYLRPWEAYFWGAMGYLLIVLTLTWLAGRLEKRLEAKGS
jgi:His/Glu/Gln/Arg/opine family amino acid ABC transporter permease subunit